MLFRQVALSEVQKGPDVIQCWASTVGHIFKNDCFKATSGQQQHTGLTDDGETQYDEHLADNIEAREEPAKRRFDKDHLAWLKPQMDIQCASYEAEVERRTRADPTEGIAQDKEKDKVWDDSVYSDEEDDESDN